MIYCYILIKTVIYGGKQMEDQEKEKVSKSVLLKLTLTDKLDKLKVHPRASYNEVIEKLYKEYQLDGMKE